MTGEIEVQTAKYASMRSGRALSWSTRAMGCVVICLLLGSCAAVRDVKDWLHPSRAPKPVAEKIAAPPPPPPSPPRQKPPPREPQKPEKPPERLAEVDPNTLMGLNPSMVEKILGAPSRVSKNDLSLVWTYAAVSCSFQVFFYPDLKTATFHVLKFGGVDEAGQQLAPSQECIRNILTVKSDTAG